eukprot:jgi/Bigna1/126868/aug1.3_g1576
MKRKMFTTGWAYRSPETTPFQQLTLVVFGHNNPSALLFVVWILVISSVIFYLERGTYNEQLGYYERETFNGRIERSPFLSIPETCWWMVATITTVGYGDFYPTSTAGRIVGSLAMFISIVFLAIPISLVAVNIEEATKE